MLDVFVGLAKELRQEGVKVEVVPGWKNRGRVGTFGPRGMMNHHTASSAGGGDHPALGIVTHGRSDLPGPLANFIAARSGKIIFVAAGRCNHGGTGGPFRFIGRDAANASCLSVEIENNGVGEPYPADQREAVEILNAVVLKRLQRGRWHSVGHKEYTDRKIDPSFDMPNFRDRLKNIKKRLGKKLWNLTATKTITGGKKARAAAKRLRTRGWKVSLDERH